MQIQNDQCQEMDQTGSEKWIKLTSNGEWWEPIRLGTLFKFKGTVHSKSNIQSSFTLNLYDFLSSAEHQEDILKNADNKPFREPKLFSYQISSFVFQGKVRNKMWVREWSQNIICWVNWLFKGFAVLMSNVAVFCMSQVNLKSGTNILYWRTTGMLLGGKPVKPVLWRTSRSKVWDSDQIMFTFVSRTLLYEESRCSLNYLRCDILWSYYVFCACFVSRCGVHLRVFSMQAGHLQ